MHKGIQFPVKPNVTIDPIHEIKRFSFFLTDLFLLFVSLFDGTVKV